MNKHAKTIKRVNESVARPTRTALQMSPAYLVVWFVDETFWNLKDTSFGIAVVLVTLFFNWLQVTIENNLGQGFMRSVPPTTVPVVDGETPVS